MKSRQMFYYLELKPHIRYKSLEHTSGIIVCKFEIKHNVTQFITNAYPMTKYPATYSKVSVSVSLGSDYSHSMALYIMCTTYGKV